LKEKSIPGEIRKKDLMDGSGCQTGTMPAMLKVELLVLQVRGERKPSGEGGREGRAGPCVYPERRKKKRDSKSFFESIQHKHGGGPPRKDRRERVGT